MAASPSSQSTSLARIITIIEGIERKVEPIQQMQTDFAVMRKEFETLCKKVDGHDYDLNGNGKSGLKDDVSHLKSRMRVITWAASIVGTSLIVFSVSLWIYLLITFGGYISP